MAALRSEFAAVRPQLLAPAELARSVAKWGDDITDARVAGRLAPIEALLQAAGDTEARDRTTAAIFLARRLDEPPPKAQLDELKRLDAMTPEQRRAHFLALADAELGGQG